MDLGPNTEIDQIKLDVQSNPDFPVEQFEAFLSDKFVEAPKRNSLQISHLTPTLREAIFSAVLRVFDTASNPIKLFQKIVVNHFDDESVKCIQNEENMKLVNEELGDDKVWQKRTFRKINPKLKMALDVTFNKDTDDTEFQLVHM